MKSLLGVGKQLSSAWQFGKSRKEQCLFLWKALSWCVGGEVTMFRILFGKRRDKEIPSSSFTHKCAMITFLSTRACVYLCDRLRSHVCTKNSLGDLRPTRRVKGDTQEFQRPWGTEILHCYLVYFLIQNMCSPFEGLYTASLQCLRNIFLCWFPCLLLHWWACLWTSSSMLQHVGGLLLQNSWQFLYHSDFPLPSWLDFFFFKIFPLKKKKGICVLF